MMLRWRKKLKVVDGKRGLFVKVGVSSWSPGSCHRVMVLPPVILTGKKASRKLREYGNMRDGNMRDGDEAQVSARKISCTDS
jgi:hypothetical protein